jgi:hypothetical protein
MRQSLDTQQTMSGSQVQLNDYSLSSGFTTAGRLGNIKRALMRSLPERQANGKVTYKPPKIGLSEEEATKRAHEILDREKENKLKEEPAKNDTVFCESMQKLLHREVDENKRYLGTLKGLKGNSLNVISSEHHKTEIALIHSEVKLLEYSHSCGKNTKNKTKKHKNHTSGVKAPNIAPVGGTAEEQEGESPAAGPSGVIMWFSLRCSRH